MWLDIIILFGGLLLLIKGSDIFVDSSVWIAKLFKLSEMFIGLTLVCFGTGLPELILSLIGNIKGSAELVLGNMVGTNIFNICGILGIICLINPVMLIKDTVKKDMYMSLATGVVFLLVLLDTAFGGTTKNMVATTDALILLIFFAVYIYYTFYHFEGITDRRRRKIEEKAQGKKEEKAKYITKENKRDFIEKIFLCIIGAALVYVGSEAVIKGAVGIAEKFGVSETLISIMILAVGTSLPEIATSISAVKKGSINVAIGNLIGSNMYNMLFVVGLTSAIKPLTLASPAIWVDCIVFIVVCIVLVIFAKARYVRRGEYEISRTEGVVLLIIYICYIVYVVFRC